MLGGVSYYAFRNVLFTTWTQDETSHFHFPSDQLVASPVGSVSPLFLRVHHLERQLPGPLGGRPSRTAPLEEAQQQGEGTANGQSRPRIYSGVRVDGTSYPKFGGLYAPLSKRHVYIYILIYRGASAIYSETMERITGVWLEHILDFSSCKRSQHACTRPVHLLDSRLDCVGYLPSPAGTYRTRDHSFDLLIILGIS